MLTLSGASYGFLGGLMGGIFGAVAQRHTLILYKGGGATGGGDKYIASRRILLLAALLTVNVYLLHAFLQPSSPYRLMLFAGMFFVAEMLVGSHTLYSIYRLPTQAQKRRLSQLIGSKTEYELEVFVGEVVGKKRISAQEWLSHPESYAHMDMTRAPIPLTRGDYAVGIQRAENALQA